VDPDWESGSGPRKVTVVPQKRKNPRNFMFKSSMYDIGLLLFRALGINMVLDLKGINIIKTTHASTKRKKSQLQNDRARKFRKMMGNMDKKCKQKGAKYHIFSSKPKFYINCHVK
jgi:hypothetical protein